MQYGRPYNSMDNNANSSGKLPWFCGYAGTTWATIFITNLIGCSFTGAATHVPPILMWNNAFDSHVYNIGKALHVFTNYVSNDSVYLSIGSAMCMGGEEQVVCTYDNIIRRITQHWWLLQLFHFLAFDQSM